MRVTLTTLLSCSACIACCVASGLSWAVGTPSGTAVNNVATLQYTLSGSSRQITSNAASFRVDEIVNVVVRRSDADNVVVTSPDVRRVLTFSIANTGNGPQRFVLAASVAATGGQFEPIALRIALDTNGNGLYEPTIDPDYQPGQNDPVVAPDRALTVFVLADIPAARAGNDIGAVGLTVRLAVGTGAPGTVFAGKGAGGSDAVVGATGGASTAQDAYVVSQLQPVLIKTQTVANPLGGTIPLPGSVVTYSLRLELRGIGTTANGLIADAIPTNTSYVAGSLKLDGTPLSDGTDADAGRLASGAIEVSLGAMVAPATHVVTFQVRLN